MFYFHDLGRATSRLFSCGGLTFAIALKRKLGYKNFVVCAELSLDSLGAPDAHEIYESAAGIGGTWRVGTLTSFMASCSYNSRPIPIRWRIHKELSALI